MDGAMRIALAYNAKKYDDGDGGSKSRPSENHHEDNYDDHYAEWDDMETIEAVRDVLKESHDEVELVEADEEAYDRFREVSPDLVFNIAEGLVGESREAHIPAVLELLGIPYTGSAPLALALCLNKARCKQILEYYSVPTADFKVVEDPSKADVAEFPAIVKPLFEGSSKGIRNDSIVGSSEDLEKKAAFVIEEYGQPALVESFLEGREFTVAMLGNSPLPRVLPIVELNYSSLPEGVNHIYSYEAKWVLDKPEAPLDIFSCPAKLDEALEEAITDTAVRAFNALGVRDWCRIDIRLDSKGVPNIIELNPLPGIIPSPECNSCFPKAARADGMEFGDLVNSVVDLARERYGI